MRRAVLVTALWSVGCGRLSSPVAPLGESSGYVADASTATSASAKYVVTLDAGWSVSTHPSDFPDNAHFSPLVGAAHASGVAFWREGVLASDGIRAMAERGATAGLENEVQQAIAAGTAQRSFVGPAIGRSPGTAALQIEVSQAYPLVTLVTMVAPSPDWFMGVSALPLFQNGAWREAVRIDLEPWDAGTDSGVTFRSADQETLPHVPVFRILSFPFLNQGRVAPLGTLSFKRVQ